MNYCFRVWTELAVTNGKIGRNSVWTLSSFLKLHPNFFTRPITFAWGLKTFTVSKAVWRNVEKRKQYRLSTNLRHWISPISDTHKIFCWRELTKYFIVQLELGTELRCLILKVHHFELSEDLFTRFDFRYPSLRY